MHKIFYDTFGFEMGRYVVLMGEMKGAKFIWKTWT
jgi:hypothetical protein